MEESVGERLARARRVLALLAPRYPEARPALVFASPFELLVATVLSAQCTDAMVNKVTPGLFARWPDAAALAAADPGELEDAVHSTGFFRAKARNLRGLSAIIAQRHGGEVPQGMAELTALPGVGRKTAGVVRSACFGFGAIIVDTHFGRLCRRLGFSAADDPLKVETDIARFLPESEWTDFSHRLNMHGRDTCKSRTPHCRSCEISIECPKIGVSPI